MRITPRLWMGSLSLLLWAVTAAAQPGGTSMLVEQLPPAARQAIERQAEGRQIVSITARAGENQDTIFEARVAGEANRTVEIAVDQSGNTRARFLLPRAAGLDGR